MADLMRSFEELGKSFDELTKKFRAYLETSKYDSKKDVDKWFADLSKATKEVEAALADTQRKLEATKTAYDEFLKTKKRDIKQDKTLQVTLSIMRNAIETQGELTDKIQNHLNRHKA